MKVFSKWLALTIALYLVTSLGLHFYYSSSPEKVFVLVDASFGMKSRWGVLKNRLKTMSTESRYKMFSMSTGKNLVHSWSNEIEIGTTLTYGPRKLQQFLTTASYPELEEADQRILLTNDAKAIELFSEQGWQTIRL